MRKIFSILAMFALISAMVWAAVQNYTSDSVSIPTTIETKAGDTITVSVSAVTSHPYAAFQMEIVLPNGMKPVLKSSGLVSIKKNSDRIADHSISGNYKDNTVIIACYSGENEPISGDEGQLFSFQVKVSEDMKAGSYSYVVKNITFTTSSTAPEGVVQYDLDSFEGIIVVSEDADPQELLDQISDIEGAMNDFVYQNATSFKELQDIIADAKQAASGTITTFQMDEYLKNIWNAYDNAEQMEGNYKQLASNIENLNEVLSQYPDADSTVVVEADSLIAQAQQILVDLNSTSKNVSNLIRQMQNVSSELSMVSLTINVAEPGTMESLVREKFDPDEVQRLIVSGNLDDNDFAFMREGFWNLVYLDLTETSITYIPNELFVERSSLRSLKLPKNLEGIGDDAFGWCSNLEEIVFPSTLQTIGERAFADCRIKAFELPEGFQTIGWDAFINCYQLESVVLPSTLTYVGENPFCNDGNLKSLTCKAINPPSVHSTFMCGDYNCTLYVPIMSVDAYKSAKGWRDFRNIVGFDMNLDLTSMIAEADSLQNLPMWNGIKNELKDVADLYRNATEQEDLVEGWSTLSSLLSQANQSVKIYDQFNSTIVMLADKIENNTSTDTLLVNDAIQLLQSSRIEYENQNLSDDVVSKRIETLNTIIHALSCVSLTIHIETAGTLNSLIVASLDSLGLGMDDVSGLTLTGNLQENGAMNKNDISALRSLKSLVKADLFETNLTTIPSSLFAGKNSLTTVILPKETEIISNKAFNGCANLASIEFPLTLKQIMNSAFSGCNSLVSVEIPEGVTKLDQYAFQYCNQLTQVTLPSSLTSVSAPFIGCSSLTMILCKAMVPPSTNGRQVMGGQEWLCTLYVPAIAIQDYRDASYWNYFNIQAGNFAIDNITVKNELWLDTEQLSDMTPSINVAMYDRGDGYWEPERYEFGVLHMYGDSLLSLNNFKMAYDPYVRWIVGDDQKYRSSAVLVNNAPMRANTVSIDMRMQAYLWNFISLPFDIKVSDIQWKYDNQPYAIYKYDGKKRALMDMNNTWVRMTADSTLHAGVGYIWQVASSYDEATGSEYENVSCVLNAQDNENKNNIFRKDDAVVPMAEYLSEYPQDRSWNLLGNPYPSYFTSRAMNITAPFTIWNVNNQNYEAMSPRDDDYVFAPGEAFFFQRPLDQEAITFLSAGRQESPESNGNVFFNDARGSEKSALRYVFNLNVSGNEQSDRSRFVINADATLGYELDKDASKFTSMTNTLQLYTIEQGLRYAINERPLSNNEVKLGMTIAKKGTYTLNVETKADNSVYVIDRVTGAEVLLGAEGYVFESEAGTFDNRFVIRLGAGEATGISELKSNAEGQRNFYRMDGVRIQKPQKGVYIENGKKVVVK